MAQPNLEVYGPTPTYDALLGSLSPEKALAQPLALVALQPELPKELELAPEPPSLSLQLGGVAVAEMADRSQEVYRLSRNSDTYEITVDSDITLADHAGVTPPDIMAKLKEWAEPLKGKIVAFINPTMEGGGVAMLRPPLIHTLKLLGVDAHWFVLEPDAEAFKVTKKIHNISQDVAGENLRLDSEDKATHQRWIARNATVLASQETLQKADAIVLDDPQPAPLLRYIKGHDEFTPGGLEHRRGFNEGAKIIFRNHIHTDRELMANPTSPQGEVAAYLRDECGVNDENIDAYVAHPVESFVPDYISEDKVAFLPAVSDPFDDLNRELTEQEKKDGLSFINEQLAAHENQTPIERGDKLITLIARFDPSKGMHILMEMYADMRDKMQHAGELQADMPKLVLIGNGSIDDPDGNRMLANIMNLRNSYPDLKNDIKVVRLKHNYKAINALMRVTAEGGGIGANTSEREGFEHRASEWITVGQVPVVVSNRGGLPLQVIEGRSGHVIDLDDPDRVRRGGEILHELMTNQAKYDLMKAATKEIGRNFNRREFSTAANTARWLRVFNGQGNKRWKISEMTG